MKKSIGLLCMMFMGCFIAFGHDLKPVVGTVSIDPALSITHFNFYTLSVDVDPHGTEVTGVTFIVRPQAVSDDTLNWDYNTNNTPVPDPNVKLEYAGANTSGQTWSYSTIRPDDIYPEIFFIQEITETPKNSRFYQGNYHLMRFTNPFEMRANTNFFIEFYATPDPNPPPSQDIEVYLVGKGYDSSAFGNSEVFANEAWKSHADVELVGTVNRDDPFHHEHGENSKHFLIPLSANSEGEIGNKGIDINDNFWIILYVTTNQERRGWDMKFHDTGCNNNTTWYQGSGTSFAAQSGCPDVHVHFARQPAPSSPPISDGMEVEVSVDYTYNGTSGTITNTAKYFYFAEIPNMPPNASSFTGPEYTATFSGNVNISWNAATDPNNDPLTYNLKVVDAVTKGVVYTAAENLTALTLEYDLNTKLLPDGSYDILVEACDSVFCTGFYWMSTIGSETETFTISNTGATKTWEGNASSGENTNWNNAGNWDTAGVPVGADEVVIPSTPTNQPIIPTGHHAIVSSLTIQDNAQLTVAPGASLSVPDENALTNSAGASGLLIQSDASGTGSLLHNTDNLLATIERYISGAAIPTAGDASKYHLVSVPLTQSPNPLSGLFLGSYLYSFDPAKQDWHFEGSGTTNELSVNKGYMIYYPDVSKVYSFAGTMNNGTFSMSVDYSTVGDYSGFNLVPNPYPTALDWNLPAGWTRTNLNNALWIWNPSEANYASYVDGVGINGGTRYIPQGQAFFVQANAIDPVLTVNNAARVVSSQPFFKSDNEQLLDVLRIKASANGFSDEMVVRLRPDATPVFDREMDASKMFGLPQAPQLYAHAADQAKLSIYSHPHPTEKISIPIGFELAADGQVELQFSGMAYFNNHYSLMLEDLMTEESLDLRTDDVYTFDHAGGQMTPRFVLHISPMATTGVDDRMADAEFGVYQVNEKIHIDIPLLYGNHAYVEVFDMSGKRQLHEMVMLGNAAAVNASHLRGPAIVRVTSDGRVFSKRLIIN